MFKKQFCGPAVFAVMLLVISEGMYAQSPADPNAVWEPAGSPVASATWGLFATDFDMAFGTLNFRFYQWEFFDHWLGSVSFETPAAYLGLPVSPINAVNLGFATRINSAFLAVTYNGNFWAGLRDNSYNEHDIAGYDSANPSAQKTFKEYDSIPTFTDAYYDYSTNTQVGATMTNYNRASVLVGAGGMGIRLAYLSHYQSFKKTDIYDGTDFYKNYEAEYGVIDPQLAWSLSNSLTGSGIRPWATLDLNFVRNYLKTERYDNTGEKIERSENYFNPKLAVGMGGYTFYSNDGFSFDTDLEYTLKMRFYDNEYSYPESSVSKVKTGFKGKNNGTDLSEETYQSHLVSPSLTLGWAGDALSFKTTLVLDTTITAETSTEYVLKNNNTADLEKNGNDQTTTTVSFSPVIKLGAQWHIVPGKFTLVAGDIVQFSPLSFLTTEGKKYTNGVAGDSFKNVSHTSDGPSYNAGLHNTLSLALIFNPAEHWSLEATAGVSNNGINVFDTAGNGGLFHFTNIMVTMKF